MIKMLLFFAQFFIISLGQCQLQDYLRHINIYFFLATFRLVKNKNGFIANVSIVQTKTQKRRKYLLFILYGLLDRNF